jgi:hypothetical protein
VDYYLFDNTGTGGLNVDYYWYWWYKCGLFDNTGGINVDY